MKIPNSTESNTIDKIEVVPDTHVNPSTPMRSRISRKLESKSKLHIFAWLIGIVIVLFLIIQFGVPLLIQTTSVISGANNETETSVKSKSAEYVAPPQLDPVTEATNSGEIIVSGISQENLTIKLFVNGRLTDELSSKKDGSFKFTEVPLKPGENTIRAKAQKDKDSESDFSEIYTVTYLNNAPDLSVEEPANDRQYEKENNTAEVKGKTDPNVKVTVNDLWAIVNDEGQFSYNVPLREGDNTIKIVATDPAGNKTETERKVKYSP